MSERRASERRPGLWIGLAIGAPIMAWGVRGILGDAGRTRPGELARWIVGSAVVHDAIVLPVVVAAAVVARRLAPAPAWPAVRWALATSAVVALVSWPFVRGYGRSPGNPSLLPRDYASGVAVALALVWVGAGCVALVRWRRSVTR